MIATQKLKRLTAVSFKYYSNAKKCENGFFWQIFDTKFQVTSVYSLENTDILEQIMCFDRKDVSLKFNFLLDNVLNKVAVQRY